MRRFVRGLLITAVLALPLGSVRAQRGPTLSIGTGGGWAGTTCTGCIASNENGPAGFVSLTARVPGASRLGGEYDRWTNLQFGERSAFDYYLAVAELSASELPALSAKFGVGYGRTRFRQWDVAPTPLRTERDGLAYVVGVAYDVRLNERLTIAPSSQIIATRNGAATVNGSPDDVDHTTSVVQYGILLPVR